MCKSVLKEGMCICVCVCVSVCVFVCVCVCVCVVCVVCGANNHFGSFNLCSDIPSTYVLRNFNCLGGLVNVLCSSVMPKSLSTEDSDDDESTLDHAPSSLDHTHPPPAASSLAVSLSIQEATISILTQGDDNKVCTLVQERVK